MISIVLVCVRACMYVFDSSSFFFFCNSVYIFTFNYYVLLWEGVGR